MKCHRLGGLNNRDLFSHSTRGWKFKSKCLLVMVSSWLAGDNFNVCSHGRERERDGNRDRDGERQRQRWRQRQRDRNRDGDRQRKRETGTKIDRQLDRDEDRDRERNRERETERETQRWRETEMKRGDRAISSSSKYSSPVRIGAPLFRTYLPLMTFLKILSPNTVPLVLGL